MISVNLGPLENIIEKRNQTSEIRSVILRASSQLAECECEEIDNIIQLAIDTVSEIERAEGSGWYALTGSGTLGDLAHSSHGALSPYSTFDDGLRELPWCLTQLVTDEAVVINSLREFGELHPSAEVDRRSLRARGVQSLVLVPSKSSCLGKTLLILLSKSTEIDWSGEIVEQCALLENILCNAYQRRLARTERNLKKNELCRKQTEIGLLASQLIQSQENERKHLSRELHDDIGQRLSLAASEVALLASQHAGSSPISVERLNTLRDELDGLCSDVHEMSHNLHSYKLQHLGLKVALKDLSMKLSQPNFRVDLHADELEEPSSKEVALCLYRIAQESLNNALKHAHALVVAITLTKIQNTFYMTVQDSGIGFDNSIRSQGLGLLSMSERVKLLNGQFRLHSLPGRGTEIWIEVPDYVPSTYYL